MSATDGAVEDRALAPAVLVGDGVEHQALARGEADPHPPLLPAQLVAVELEARALRLADLDRLEVRRGVPDRLRRCSWRPRRQRHDAAVLDRDHLHRVQVDDGDQVGDRPGVAVVAAGPARPRSARGQPAALLVLGSPKLPADHGSTMARLKSVTPRLRMAACQRGSARTAASHSTNSSSTMAGWTPGHVLPGHHAPRGQRDDRLVGLAGPESISTTKAARSTASPGRCPSTTFLAGSCSMMKMTRTRGPSARSARTISHARSISAALERIQRVDGRRHTSSPAVYSMIWSAWARIDGGTVRPIAFAVLRFRTSSNRSACSTARSTRPGALEQPVDVRGGAPLRLREARGIAHEAAALHGLLEREDGRQPLLPGDLRDAWGDPVDQVDSRPCRSPVPGPRAAGAVAPRAARAP